jgi:hypothetical protein
MEMYLVCDLEEKDCINSAESNVDVINHICKIGRIPVHCAHYCFKKKIPYNPESPIKASS